MRKEYRKAGRVGESNGEKNKGERNVNIELLRKDGGKRDRT
jgi:hypothetical protein